MKKLVTIPGSSSKTSINKQLAEYVGNLVSNVELVNIDFNDYKIPMYSVDEEIENGFSDAVMKLNEVIESADALVISLAEHNGAYSVAFKNVFDWLSRVESKLWRDKPMLLLSTSPGARGGASVLEIAKGRFPYMGGNIIGSLSIPSFQENFKDGEIVNAELKSKLLELVEEFQKTI